MASEQQILETVNEPGSKHAHATHASHDFQDAKSCCGDYLQKSQNSQHAENIQIQIGQVPKSDQMQHPNQSLVKMGAFSELSVVSEKSEASEISDDTSKAPDEPDGPRSRRTTDAHNSYAANRNVAEGLMDIALLSANANQLRFLITYNHAASTYYISLGLIVLSLTLQVAVGIALIFKRRLKRRRGRDKRLARMNEFLIGGVFMVTVVNILLAAFTTTDAKN